MTIGKSSETVKGEPAEESIFQHGDIFGVKGKAFTQQFMANFVLPTRREVATMVLASKVQAGWDPVQDEGYRDEITSHVEECFTIADAFISAEFETLDVEKYFALYMNGPASKDISEVLAAAVDKAQDYSL